MFDGTAEDEDRKTKLANAIFFLRSCLFFLLCLFRSVRVAERLAFSTLDHGVAGSNPAGGEILSEP